MWKTLWFVKVNWIFISRVKGAIFYCTTQAGKSLKHVIIIDMQNFPEKKMSLLTFIQLKKTTTPYSLFVCFVWYWSLGMIPSYKQAKQVKLVVCKVPGSPCSMTGIKGKSVKSIKASRFCFSCPYRKKPFSKWPDILTNQVLTIVQERHKFWHWTVKIRWIIKKGLQYRIINLNTMDDTYEHLWLL